MNVVPIISNTLAYYLVLCSTSLHITVTCQIYIIPMVKQHLLIGMHDSIVFYRLHFNKILTSYVLRLLLYFSGGMCDENI